MAFKKPDPDASPPPTQPAWEVFVSSDNEPKSPEGIYIMPFGKHKGSTITAVPRSYLEWALREASSMRPGLRQAIADLLDGRGTTDRALHPDLEGCEPPKPAGGPYPEFDDVTVSTTNVEELTRRYVAVRRGLAEQQKKNSSLESQLAQERRARRSDQTLLAQLEDGAVELRKTKTDLANIRAKYAVLESRLQTLVLAHGQQQRTATPANPDMSEFRRIVRQWFGAMSRRFHPDHGGSAEKQAVVNICYNDLTGRLPK